MKIAFLFLVLLSNLIVNEKYAFADSKLDSQKYCINTQVSEFKFNNGVLDASLQVNGVRGGASYDTKKKNVIY